MTLLYLGLALAAIVFALVATCWETSETFRKAQRERRVRWERALRQPEDDAWQNRELHYQAAIAIALRRREADSFQALLELLPDGRTLEVVA